MQLLRPFSPFTDRKSGQITFPGTPLSPSPRLRGTSKKNQNSVRRSKVGMQRNQMLTLGSSMTHFSTAKSSAKERIPLMTNEKTWQGKRKTS